MPLLFVIEDVLPIKARGVVACGTLANPECSGYRVGDAVEIRRRDWSVAEPVVYGIPLRMLAASMADVLLGGVIVTGLDFLYQAI